MLNYETLLSSYDDKLTLMQWLKKVEAALKDASAVSFNVNKRGDATLTFSVVFEDGSELETGPIVLEQGESVSSASIVNGHLILFLTNGNALDAGDLGGVSGFSIDASQHLIVTYQNGTTQDLGAIFSGNVVISGNLKVTGLATLPNIEGDENGNINVDGDIILSDGGVSITDGAVSTPILTSPNDHVEAQKPVVEVMSGYSAVVANELASWEKSINYIGACKNGNKLTLVVNLKLKRLSTTSVLTPNIIVFTIPTAIGAKLIPSAIGTYNYLDQKIIPAFYSPASFLDIPMRMSKQSNYQITLSANLENLVVDTEYLIRYEVTYLLGNSLI